MKASFAITFSLLLANVANAGIVGWWTAESRDWQFIQHSGGIKIGAPLEKEGRTVLPVDYWPEGNSGLVVRKIEMKMSGTRMIIQVVTQLVEKGSNTARIHYVDLSGVSSGTHDVYYEIAGDREKLIGHIEIK
jgi:hypothetical protein